MSIEDLRKDAAAAGGQAELLFQAAERSATKFMFFAGPQREAFIHGFIDGATLMTGILRPRAANDSEPPAQRTEP